MKRLALVFAVLVGLAISAAPAMAYYPYHNHHNYYRPANPAYYGYRNYGVNYYPSYGTSLNVGFGVPSVLMPAPGAIAARFAVSLPTLGEDFVQTFIRGVLSGYVIGCGAGFLTAVVADRFSFLERGLQAASV